MSLFSDDNELKHPAFHDEPQIEKKQTWAKILDFLFGVIVVLGLVALVLCILILFFSERIEL